MKHDNFLKAQEWLNSCDYPEIDSALEWLDAIALRTQIRVFFTVNEDDSSIYGHTPQELYHAIKMNEESNDEVFEDFMPLSKIFDADRKESSPVNGLTIKELSTLTFCAVTNKTTRESLIDVFKFGLLFNQEKYISAGEDMRFNKIEELFSGGEKERQHVSNWDSLDDVLVNSVTDVRMNANTQHRLYMSIDPSCSKEVLMKQFSRWLSTELKAYNLTVKKDYNSMFKTWNSRKYLALLDLKIWETSFNIKLTTNQKIELLYPELSIDEDNYRKTYEVGAESMMDSTMIGKLKSIANVNNEML